MKNSNLVISDRRFLRSPFFDCYHHKDVLYGVYNNRLYPLSCGYDDQSEYEHLRKYCCLYDVPETPLRITGKDQKAFLEKIFTRNITLCCETYVLKNSFRETFADTHFAKHIFR